MAVKSTFVAAASAALFALSLGLSAAPANASHCGTLLMDHNGSVMETFACDDGVSVHYDEPRPLMRRQNVRQGTLLFKGRYRPNGRLVGTARVFKRGCGALAYRVSGTFRNGVMKLYGQAPVRGGDCAVKGFRNDVLVFREL